MAVDAPQRPRLRVLHLTTAGTGIAGAEQLLVGIAQRADRTRWDLGFCTVQVRGNMHDALAREGWPVSSLDVTGVSSVPTALVRFTKLLASFRPDILHTHLSHASLLGALAATVDRRLPLVQTRHYIGYVERFRRRRAGADRWAARHCDRVIAVSEGARAQLVDNEGVAPERALVIENGVDCERLEAYDPAEGRKRLAALGVPPGLVIGCAGSFNAQKGHTYLLQAMARVLQELPTARLVLLGMGRDEAATRAEVEQRGLSERVHFLGHREDAHSLMAAFDIYVQPSVEEGFGLAVIEAMAMRRPVIVSAVGGMLETVEPGRSGLRVPPADVAALEEAILLLARDPDRASTLGANAAQRVRELYSLERMLSRYDDVYRDALSARSGLR